MTTAPVPEPAAVERAKAATEAARVEPSKDAAAKEAAPKEAAKVAPARPHFVGQQGKAKAMALAGLRAEETGNGDRLVLSRQFGAWALKCEMLISRNERVCAIEQALRGGEPDSFQWRLATSAAGKPVVMFEFSAKAEADKGLAISIAGFDKTIPATEWACHEERCSASMAIVGPVSSWLTSSSRIEFRYDRGGEAVRTVAVMAGFEAAVTALQNPLGLKTQVAAGVATTVARAE